MPVVYSIANNLTWDNSSKATASITSVTATIDAPGPGGNAYTIEVVVAGSPNQPMSVNLSGTAITVTLGTDGAGDPDNAKNTGTLVAAAINALAGISAVADSADPLTSAEGPTQFAGGLAALTLPNEGYLAGTTQDGSAAQKLIGLSGNRLNMPDNVTVLGDANANGLFIKSGSGSPISLGDPDNLTAQTIRTLVADETSGQDLTIRTATAITSGYNGGNLTLACGDGVDASGGNLAITAGNGGEGGDIDINAGSGSNGSGGNLNLSSGSGSGGANPNGDITISSAGLVFIYSSGGVISLRSNSGVEVKNVAGNAYASITASAFTTASEQGAFTASPYGTGAGQTGEMRFKELAANGANHVGLKAPDALAADLIFTLPSADAAGPLVSDGSKVLTALAGANGTIVIPAVATLTIVKGVITAIV